MNQKLNGNRIDPDSAGVFGAAVSLLNVCRESRLDLGRIYRGWDQLMREVMRIANHFEEWACRYVDFSEVGDCWPYFLEDRFGSACLEAVSPAELRSFGEDECLYVAMSLELPIWVKEEVRVPVDIRARNPVAGSLFCELRIQTVRAEHGGGGVAAFQLGDDPFDVKYGRPFFALYGVTYEGFSEHIVDRESYVDAIELVQKLAPGIGFPEALSVKLSARGPGFGGKVSD